MSILHLTILHRVSDILDYDINLLITQSMVVLSSVLGFPNVGGGFIYKESQAATVWQSANRLFFAAYGAKFAIINSSQTILLFALYPVPSYLPWIASLFALLALMDGTTSDRCAGNFALFLSLPECRARLSTDKTLSVFVRCAVAFCRANLQPPKFKRVRSKSF